jgi:hypothetical protein
VAHSVTDHERVTRADAEQVKSGGEHPRIRLLKTVLEGDDERVELDAGLTQMWAEVDVIVADQRRLTAPLVDLTDDARSVGEHGPRRRLPVELPHRLRHVAIDPDVRESPHNDLPIGLDRGIDATFIFLVARDRCDAIETLERSAALVVVEVTADPSEGLVDPPTRVGSMDEDATEVEQNRSIPRRAVVQWPIPRRCCVW